MKEVILYTNVTGAGFSGSVIVSSNNKLVGLHVGSY